MRNKTLPAVSWLVAPQYFSDHPSAPWFGAWYVSEVLSILTHNEEIWKKTIFILTYDENDGYFDHVPPFTAPDWRSKATGDVSKTITNLDKEFVTFNDELKQKGVRPDKAREHAIGLGYRVPFIVASPWSRGGIVNSQVFDHTSVVQFIENFASRKTGKRLRLENISEWRRAICGDLSSVFHPYNGEKIKDLAFMERDVYVKNINEARFRPLPAMVNPLSKEERELLRADFTYTKTFFKQEEGIKPSSALPYELYADGNLDGTKREISFRFEASNNIFKAKAAGSPFLLYKYAVSDNGASRGEANWSFAVAAGEHLTYTMPLAYSDSPLYHFMLFGPNGFFRELRGNIDQPDLHVVCSDGGSALGGRPTLKLLLSNPTTKSAAITIKDHCYGQKDRERRIPPLGKDEVVIDFSKSSGWYDFSVLVNGTGSFERRYAGRVETGRPTISDPAMA